MTAAPVVSNASPLIALEQIGQLDLLAQLFGHVLAPPAVVRETVPQLVLPAWITEQSLAQPIAPQILQASLGAGESEAISLAWNSAPPGSFSMIAPLEDWHRGLDSP